MSMIDPESLLFSVDWGAVERDFIRRANEAGYFGLDVYNYVEAYAFETVIDQAVEQAAAELGRRVGEDVSRLHSGASTLL